MHTASINQTLTVLTPVLTERLHKVTVAIRKLGEYAVKIVGQDINAAERPVLFIATAPPRDAGLRIAKLAKRKDGTRVMVSRFGDVDVAWPAEIAS